MSPGTPTTMLRLALAGLLASAPCALWAGEVTGISVNQGSTGTRVEIQLAGAGQYKTLSLKGPDRLVVDLPASKAKAGLRLPAPTGIVRAVRTGQPDADTLRIDSDGVVRYAFVARSSSGALNVLFEGIRCQTGEVKLYAHWDKNTGWTPVAGGEWKALSFQGTTRRAMQMARGGICAQATPNGSPARILDTLRRGDTDLTR